jgi:hypothetical protein
MKTKLLSLIALGLIALSACVKYPPVSDQVTQDLVIYTKYDVNADFNNYLSFAIVPNIPVIDGNDTTYLSDGNAQALLGRISSDMVSRGFQEVAPDQNPDLGINVTMVKMTNTTVYYPGWYWGYPAYYPPDWWYYPGYDYSYPYYPVYVTSYSSGTVIIDLADFKFKEQNKIMIRWNAYIRALLTGTHSQSEILNSVDQAFLQTPVLETNGQSLKKSTY